MELQQNIINTRLYNKVMQMKEDGVWLFETITPDEFIEASSQLLGMVDAVSQRKLDGQHASIEALLDRTTESTILMLKAVQQMEAEATMKKMDSMIAWNSDQPYSMDFLKLEEFVEYAKVEMYSYNNRACDDMSQELEEKGLSPRYIDTENEKRYALNVQRDFTERTAEEHYQAMKEAYDEIDNLIKYGLPSETAVGKWKDELLSQNEIKLQNQTIVDKILKSEADLEIVYLYILPELNLKIEEYKAQAICEKTMHDADTKKFHYGNPYYFRECYKRHLEAKEAIENALRIMEERERKLQCEHKIEIKRDEKQSTVIIKASYNEGVRQEKKSKKSMLKNKFTRVSKVEKIKNRKEKSIELKSGRQSGRLYEEERRESACRLGYMNRSAIKALGKSAIKEMDKEMGHMVGAHFWRKESKTQRKTNVIGRRTYETSHKFDPLKVEGKIVYNDGKKDHTVMGASLGVGNVNAGLNTKKVIPQVKAGASFAEAKADVLGLSAKTSIGGVSYNSIPNLANKIKTEIVDDLIDRDDLDIEDARELIESAAKQPFNVSTNDYSSSVSAFGVQLTGEKLKDGKLVADSRLDDIQEKFGNTSGGVNPIEQEYDAIVQSDDQLPIIEEKKFGPIHDVEYEQDQDGQELDADEIERS